MPDDPPRPSFREWLADADIQPIHGPPPAYIEPEPEQPRERDPEQLTLFDTREEPF